MRDLRIDVHPFFKSDKIKQCPGIPEGMLDDLIKDNRCTSRVMAHRDDRGTREYWVIPLDLAEKWGMSWEEDILSINDDVIPLWVRHTHHDEISYIDYRSEKTIQKKGKPVKKQFWSGPLTMGWQAHTSELYLGFKVEHTPVTERNIKKTIVQFNARQSNPTIDPRDKAFIDYYVQTGDILNAIKVGYPHMGSQIISRCVNFANERLKKKSVRYYVEKTLNDHAKIALQKAGVEDNMDPMEWIMSQRIKIIQEAVKLPKGVGLTIADKAINKMEEALTTKVTGTLSGSVTGMNRPDPGTQLSAERKKELKAGDTPIATIKKTKREVNSDNNENDSMSELREVEFPSSPE
jgi:hypothetical protein